MYLGELISLGVAFSWTITALCIEYASKKLGTLSVNFLRLLLGFFLTGSLLLVITGRFFPQGTDSDTWLWMSVSGLIGFVFGDFCLFYSYILIGSRFGQLFMTLAPPAAAISGAIILGESMRGMAWVGMFVTLIGIALSIFSRGEKGRRMHIKLPLKGVLLGIGAGLGQGVGLVFSKLGMEHYSESAIGSSAEVIKMIPFAASQIRMIVGTISFLIILLITKKLHSVKPAFHDKKIGLSVVLGTIFGPFLGVAFSLMAVQYTESGIASTIMALTPIIIILPSVVILKQKITPLEIVGAIISVAGVSLFFL
jgi:drug/metabolite transporter (DMT)-like permease